MIALVTAHPGPANHFAHFVKEIGRSVQVFAADSVTHKFETSVKIDPTNTSYLLQALEDYDIVMTDLADDWVHLHEQLQEHCPHIKRIVYYDNPEAFVPGGYSETANKIMQCAQIVLIANKNLRIDTHSCKPHYLGYYPIDHNLTKGPDRKTFFESHNLKDTGQQIVTYIGGANATYYEKAYPRFVEILNEAQLENTLIVLKLHPRADLSYHLPLPKNVIIANDSLPSTDVVLYYQTSMAPQFVFAKIPIIAQIGHEPYSDVLTRAGYPTILDADHLKDLLQSAPIDPPSIEGALGIDPNWGQNLRSLFGSL